MATQILTLNLQGLRASMKRETFIQWLNCFRPDIVCVQETHATSILEFTNWFHNSPYQCLSSPGTNRSCGVGILIHRSFRIEQNWRDTDGHYICGELSKQNLSFRVHCLYGPNTCSEGTNFFGSLSAYIDPLIMNFFCGDFNTVLNPGLDRRGCNLSSPWAYNCPPSLSLLQTATNLCDIWRSRHPNTQQFTWHRPDGSQHSRLDMIWIPDRLVGTVQSCEILPFFCSDHSYVYLKITLPFNTPYTRSFWKLNTAYLTYESLQQEIKHFWTQWQLQKCKFQNQAVWWDGGKLGLRSLLQPYSRNQTIQSNSKYCSLHTKLTNLRTQNDLGDQSVLPNIIATEKELQQLFESKVHGAQIRSRTQWAEEGEKSSRYFFNLEKKRAQSNLIHGVYREDGSVATDTYDVIHTFPSFYQNLFSRQNLDNAAQNVILQTLERSLTEEESAKVSYRKKNVHLLFMVWQLEKAWHRWPPSRILPYLLAFDWYRPS